MELQSAVENISPPLEKRGLRVFAICDFRGSRLHSTRTYFVGTHTRVNETCERLEDSVDSRSLSCLLMPTLVSYLPNCRGHSWGIKVTGLLWSFAFRDHDDDTVVRELGKGHLSCHKLETK